MKLVILPAVLAELQAASAYYMSASNLALGRAFVAEFERAVKLVLINPTLGGVLRGAHHRYSLRRFPCGGIDQISGDELRVIALAHHRSRPAYWTLRQ